MEEPTSALEQFRQQWKEEVIARTKRTERRPIQGASSSTVKRPNNVKSERPINKPPVRHPTADLKDDSEFDSDSSTKLIKRIEGLTVKGVDDDDFSVRGSIADPKTALEHYEKAVEKESQGSLGDSLTHYRKAYKLDAKVDQTYKNKHFPAKSKSTNTNPPDTAVTVPGTAHHSSKEPTEVLSTRDLVRSFADAQIIGAPPIIEGDRAPPCPIRKLPIEVMIEMLQHIAAIDPALFVRLSLVCKKLAYHACLENSIWRRVALGSEFGLGSQQYTFATDIQGREIIYKTLEEEKAESTLPLLNELSFPKDTVWRDIFHSHPRIRFSGIYISTVNYTRPGGASATQHVWSNPIHIVTYYRYLRFFRDGTCISLLTTTEPLDVVHHLTPENLNLVRSKTGKDSGHPQPFVPSVLSHPTSSQQGKDGGSAAAPPPSAQQLMRHALRGRWRLCHPSIDSQPTSNHDNAPIMLPGDLHIETEGAGPRYMYTMHLSLKAAARSKSATKNNKLVWKGFWSYNQLTSDWAEFQLKNDKPFYFSRVKSYGLGY